MQTDVSALEVDTLREASRSLAVEVFAAAESLERASRVPARSLLERLSQHVRCCAEVRGRVQPLAGRALRTLADAQEALQAGIAIRQAQPWLTQLLRVQCDGGTVRSTLLSIQQQAASLLAASDSFDPESLATLEAVASGSHSWCDLIRLIDGGEVLDDAEWGVLLERVEQQLGRDVGVAAARRRLSLPCVTQTPPPAPSPESTSIFDDIGAIPPADEPHDNDHLCIERRAAVVQASGTTQVAATPAPRIRSAEDVTGLAWKLVDQGYPGLAAELCHAGGTLYPQVTAHLPDVFESWLAARGTPPGGQPSERWEAALTRLRERHGGRLGAVLTTSESLLLTAAVMRVVVDAPQSVSMGVLKSLPLLDEHPELFNFVTRLVALCEKLDVPLSSRPPRDMSIAAQRVALLQHVDAWWQEVRKSRPQISRTELLISKAHWSLRPRHNQVAGEALQDAMYCLATWRVIHECLKPLHEESCDLPTIQRSLARLKSRLTDVEAVSQSAFTSNRRQAVANELRTAIGFLEDFAKLQGRSPGVAVRLLPESVEALIDDLCGRSSMVADELRSIVTEQRGRPLGTAAVCCLEALAVVMRSLSGGSVADDAPVHEASGLEDELRVAGLAELNLDNRSQGAARVVIDSLAERLPWLPPRRRTTDLFLREGRPDALSAEEPAHGDALLVEANPAATSILFDFE